MPSKSLASRRKKTPQDDDDPWQGHPWSGPVKLHTAKPVRFMNWPKWLRTLVGWITLILYTMCFLMPVYVITLLLPVMWSRSGLRLFNYFMLGSMAISYIMPMREWPAFRKLGQLWFEIFDFSSNFDYKDCMHSIDRGEDQQVILAMHPHGIVPFQAVLWAAFCDEFFTNWDTGKSMFGFGAAADAVCYLPFLRNWMGWVSAGSASYSTLKKGLAEGKSSVVPNRKVKHMFVLPGGVAEIFTSTPGRNCIVFKNRKGLIKLALETGAKIAAVYVFGGTDFYHNLATGNGWLSTLSRKLKMGLTIFWGPFMQPIVPFTPKVTMAMGKPLEFPKGYVHGVVTDEMVEVYHKAYLDDIQMLFDRYKVAAGHGESQLEIL
jgi:hypothetical protein